MLSTPPSRSPAPRRGGARRSPRSAYRPQARGGPAAAWSAGRYSSAKTVPQLAAVTSPPAESVRACTTWENSICSRRGRSRECSLLMRYATPPLPDWLLTRMTAS